MVRPDRRQTSSARWIRWASVAWMRAARRPRGAHRRIGLGHVRQPAQQGVEVQAGAAGQDRDAPARGDLFHRPARVGGELGGRIGLPRLAHVDQMVRRRHLFGRAGLGRADVQAAVDQGRVDADDLRVQALRPIQRERGLARGGRAHQGDGERARVVGGGHAGAAEPRGDSDAQPRTGARRAKAGRRPRRRPSPLRKQAAASLRRCRPTLPRAPVPGQFGHFLTRPLQLSTSPVDKPADSFSIARAKPCGISIARGLARN